ncbi:MAG: hypothetical protein AB1298_08715 [Bacteroidota bacterium]
MFSEIANFLNPPTVLRSMLCISDSMNQLKKNPTHVRHYRRADTQSHRYSFHKSEGSFGRAWYFAIYTRATVKNLSFGLHKL